MLIQKLLSKDMYKYKCPYEMTPESWTIKKAER